MTSKHNFTQENTITFADSKFETTKGVFWVVDDVLLSFPFVDGASEGLAKSGDTYNHKKLGLK